MEVWRLLATQLLLLLDWAAGAPDTATCLAKGFNPAKLLCSSCADLRQFDLGAVVPDCEACCTDDGGASTLDNVKYEKAILEVCG
jgi:hypothetical protein